VCVGWWWGGGGGGGDQPNPEKRGKPGLQKKFLWPFRPQFGIKVGGGEGGGEGGPPRPLP